jgi:hypothetical protein
MDTRIKRMRFSIIRVLLLCAMAMQAHASTITTINTNDSGPGSLRQALAVAHDGDRITFTVSGTITLTSGGLVVTKNVTISGLGANQLSIDGNQATLVFGVFPQRTVSISDQRITNGQNGIWNEQGTLSVSNCVLSGNSNTALFNDAGSSGASMTVANSIISHNSGTGAFNLVPFSTLARNPADQSSGGNPCAGVCVTISDSVVSNNNADGISNAGNSVFGTASLTVVNSNVSDNDGTGISNDGCEGSANTTILSTTVSGNSAGGVFTQGYAGCLAMGKLQLPIAPSAATRPTVGSKVICPL